MRCLKVRTKSGTKSFGQIISIFQYRSEVSKKVEDEKLNVAAIARKFLKTQKELAEQLSITTSNFSIDCRSWKESWLLSPARAQSRKQNETI